MKLFLATALLLAAEGDGSIPPPPASAPPGLVRIACTPQMEPVVKRWAAAFRGRRPDLRLQIRPVGSDVAMATLYTGQADIALIGREATDMEAKAFEWIFHYPPLHLEVLTGSAGAAGRSPALAILVNSANPLSRISLDQLRALFGAGAGTIGSWSGLGVRGPLAGRAVRLYAPDAESGTGRFFRKAVLGGSTKMAWDRLTEFPEPVGEGPHLDQMGRAVAAAVARDPAGIGIASFGDRVPGTKAIALFAAGSPAALPTAREVGSGGYKLARSVYAYVNRPKGKSADPQVASLLQFILSPEGQRTAASAGYYLPLTAPRAREALRALD